MAFKPRRPLSLADRHASSAHATVRRTGWSVRIGGVIGMPCRTVSLATVESRRAQRSTVVLGMSDQRHVTDVDASPRLAEVIDLEVCRDRPPFELPSDAMNVRVCAKGVAADDAVAVPVVGAQPQPAVVRAAHLNAAPETFGNRGRFTSRPSETFGLAAGAEAPTVDAPRRVRRVDVPIPTGHDGLGPRLSGAVCFEPFRQGLRGGGRKWH